MRNTIIAIRLFLFLTLLTGVVYPLIVTGIGDVAFKKESEGSLIYKDGKLIGSELISQKFQGKKYFWPRPSAVDFNGISSGASNLSVGNETLEKAVAERKAQGATRDLLYASGSGLDPHISPAAAADQVDRISKERNLNSNQRDLVLKLIQDYTEGRQWGFLGEPRVNVLKLNVGLDKAFEKTL